MVYILSRRVEIFLTIFFSLILLPGGLHAQKGAEDYLIVERLSRENGLPDQDINGIYFDSKGYAWISTFGREADVSEHCRRLYQSVLRG